jgi:hypothetical protein
MRAEEIIFESRGVTARAPGEQYISDIDPNDVLTIQNIDVLPDGAAGYESYEELEAALNNAIPNKGKRVDDNNPNNGMTAAIIATVIDSNNQPQYWVRYLKSIPATGVHTLWKTLKGYKFAQGKAKESVPIKPSDLITDENYRSTDQIASEVMSGINSQMKGTEYESLIGVMEEAIKFARSGQVAPIKGGGPYFNVLQKYGGEYLGPLAIIDGDFRGGNTEEMLQAFGLKTLKGSTVSFPQDKAMELIDSIIQTPNGQQIQISSKISKSGGAASSLSGIAKQITPEMEQEYPLGTRIIKLLGTESAVNGPLKVARELGIIDQNDIIALSKLDQTSKNINDLQSDQLKKLTQAQGVAKGTTERDDYRLFWHTLTAVMNAVIPIVNANEEFKQAMLAALNNNNYVQVVTKGKQTGDDVSLDYYTKFPAVFQGAPKLVNKNYFATGQKGRIGFKMK